LAPLLFAISTQPLISFIDHQISSGTLQAVQVTKDLTIYHMLFADDVGIFIPAAESAFSELQNCLTYYEEASGAKLNLQKSIITPIAMDAIPQWIKSTGCSITKDGEIHKYLGAPFGTNLASAAIQNFCLDKLAKRITALKPRCISFPGRILLIKQVLQAMPVYHMMYTHLQKSTSTKIERMCRISYGGIIKLEDAKYHW
jgi:hypothetical protein